LLVATPTRSFSDFAQGLTVCCADPRPSCFLFDDPAAWEAQDWRCLRCGKPMPSLRFRSYDSVLHGTLDSFEVKRLCADGSEPGPKTMRGLTIPRPVRVESVTLIGKEVIVDPTEIAEGLTAEMLSETSTVEYVDPREALDMLRARVREAGIKAVSRESGLSRRHVQEFLNEGAVPHAETIAELEAALVRIEERATAGLKRRRAPA
jgi:DNA-binding phage protein